MGRVLGQLCLIVAVLPVTICGAEAAISERLIMPYACHPSGAIVRLTPDVERDYRIYGPRREMTVSACQSGTSCQPMIAHNFRIKCGDKIVAWDLVAAAARRNGAPMPQNMPVGFAPVAPIGGRIIFPAEKTAQPIEPDVDVTMLAAHDVEGIGDRSLVQASAWDTVVRAGELAGVRVTEGAARFGAMLALVLGIILAATIVAGAGMRPAPFRKARAGGLSSGRLAAESLIEIVAMCVATIKQNGARWIFVPAEIFGQGRAERQGTAERKSAWSAANEAYKRSGPSGQTSRQTSGPVPPPGVDVVLTMLERTETLVAESVAAPSLRGVLQGELHRLHQRLVAIETAAPPLEPGRLSAAIRSMTTELDRIARIAVSAASEREAIDVPKSPLEAYEVLGVNPDVNPTVIKKLVDALRVSWHPDHARNDADRIRREERIKQINAAWDMINENRAAA